MAMNTLPKGCNPGKGCFNCPYEDCINPSTRRTREETAMSRCGWLDSSSPVPPMRGALAPKPRHIHMELMHCQMCGALMRGKRTRRFCDVCRRKRKLAYMITYNKEQKEAKKKPVPEKHG